MSAPSPGSGQAQTIAIVGSGAWGTMLAILAHDAGNRIHLLAHREELAVHLRTHRTHPYSLEGAHLPDAIQVTTDITVLDKADVVIMAVPTQKLRRSLEPIATQLDNRIVLSVIKGLEVSTRLTPSRVIAEVVPTARVAVLSGPNLAGEIAQGLPATSVIAANDERLASHLVGTLHSSRFRVYTSTDVIGVELGGALKNVIAIGAGIGDGLGAGQNAKAAFMTRGIAEIARLGVACGAKPLTFAGLSGIGDLIATCASSQSRNHRVGVALAAGQALEDILGNMTEVAEGVPTTLAARELGRELGVELPISEQLYRVLYEGISPAEAISALMEREPTKESIG